MQPEVEHDSDSSLISASVDGDLGAFETLYRRYSSRVYGLCMRLTRNEAEAEDTTQETFIKAWQELARFRGQSSLATWLHRIAVNEVLSRRRRTSTEQRYLNVVELEHEAELEQELQSSRAALEPMDLERAIARLPERMRAAFVLNKVYGYTHEEAGRMLGIAAGTCKVQVFRAARILSGLLEEAHDA
jgi:RNA polymerase sigma-70 factor, ECF subfamily